VGGVIVLAGVLIILLLALPVAAIFVRLATQSGASEALAQPMVLEALRLSAWTSLLALSITLVAGTPLAYALARFQFIGRSILDSLIDLPIVLPPAVAGIGLLMAFGRRGLLGPWLESLGITLGFTTAAVVLAQLFVSAPFYIRAARAGFQTVDQELEAAASVHGVSSFRTFWHVTVPVAGPALLGGAAMCWARALGEFGATIMFAGSFAGRTQTMPLAIYAALETDLNAALVLSAVLVLVSTVLLLSLRLILRRVTGMGI
jgi:molybdate transport system permease protein